MEDQHLAPRITSKDQGVAPGNGKWDGPIYSLGGAHYVWLGGACYLWWAWPVMYGLAGPVMYVCVGPIM